MNMLEDARGELNLVISDCLTYEKRKMPDDLLQVNLWRIAESVQHILDTLDPQQT